MFPNPQTGKPYTRINKGFKSALKKAGLSTEIRVHDLRHSYAKLALDAGVPLQVLRELLGHANIQTTLVYTHITLDNKRAAVELLDNPEKRLRLIESK